MMGRDFAKFEQTHQIRNEWQTINNTGSNLERITYDANGNILTLRRDGQKNKTDMDKLKYNYIAGTNKLDYIQDTVTNTKRQPGRNQQY